MGIFNNNILNKHASFDIKSIREELHTVHCKLAPRDLCNRPALGRKPARVSRLGADPTWKGMWRFIRTWVCHNHKLYYTYVLSCALGLYLFWWHTLVGFYRQKNAHRSLEWAMNAEKEWEANKPPEDDDDDDEEEDE